MGCNSSRAVASVPPPQPTVNPQKAPGIPTSVSSVFDHDFPGLKPASGKVEDRYDIGELLGKGSFGHVYLGRDKQTGESVAVKIMDRAKIKAASIEREWTVLSHLGTHPHVVGFKSAYVTPANVCFVMELMRGGELFDRLIQRGAYSEADARRPFHQVAMALNYLHKRGIIHRDLKPENLLLSDDSADAAVKIADFGLSQLVPKEEKMTKVCGTWAYAAPEMSDPHSGGYDCKYDTWGFGVILFVVLSGYHPFDPEGGLPVAEIKARARAARFDFEQPEWDVVSETAKDLLRKLIVKDPANRLDSGQLLKHPWFTADVSNLPIAPDMGNKISAYQQRRRKLKASFYSSFFVASLLMSASRKGRAVSDSVDAAATPTDVLSGGDEEEGDRPKFVSASGASAPPLIITSPVTNRMIQESKSMRSSLGTSMRSPQTRLATIPSATGAAAKAEIVEDDEDGRPVMPPLTPTREGLEPTMARSPHAEQSANKTPRKSHGNKVAPVTVEELS